MAPVPGGEPAVPQPGDGAGARAPRPLSPRRLSPRWRNVLFVAATGLIALRLADQAGVVGRGAVPELTRAGLAAVVLFGLTGLGITRLLLPRALRAYEPLWVLPIGACATGLSMTALGYAYVPFRLNLAIVLLAGTALSLYAVRRDGLPGRAALRRSAWPMWLALLLAAVSLIPLFRAGFATVEGQGQDAHLAVGTAIFLQRHHPTDVAPQEAVDRVPLQWGSKHPIYYALAANASLAGLEVFQTISTTAAMLLGMAVLGFFLLAVCVLRGPPWAGLVAIGVVGLDPMVLHTIMHPYFNQSWGFFAMPFTFVLAWQVVQEPTRATAGLLALFSAMVFLAYPLAFPIAGIPLAFFAWEHRAQLHPRRFYSSRRSLVWMVPAGLLLSVPIVSGIKKVESAQNVIFNVNRDLGAWGGDLTGWFPEPEFFAMSEYAALVIAAPVLCYAIFLALRDQDRLLRRALYAVLAFALVFAIYFRIRAVGYYFHFKTLAFIAPIALTIAAVGFARFPRRRLGITAAVLLLWSANIAASHEISTTFDELPQSMLALRQIDRELPPGQSVRLDIDPQEQNWAAFMLHGQPLCSQKPLLGTDYPRVPISRKADWIVTPKGAPVPRDALPTPRTQLERWTLYKARPDIPGVDRCSQRMVQRVTKITV